MKDGGATAAGCGGGGGGGSEAQAPNSNTAENTTNSFLSMIIPQREFRNGDAAHPRTNIVRARPARKRSRIKPVPSSSATYDRSCSAGRGHRRLGRRPPSKSLMSDSGQRATGKF